MLVCACAQAAGVGPARTPGTQVSPYVVPLARVDGWRLSAPTAAPPPRVALAYDLAAARAAWASARAGNGARRTGSGGELGVYTDLDRVDFSRQAVLVVESGGSSSCPPYVLDVRRTVPTPSRS